MTILRRGHPILQLPRCRRAALGVFKPLRSASQRRARLEGIMRNKHRAVFRTVVLAAAAAAAAAAFGDADLDQAMSNPANWASQAGDYANHRHSTLNQVNEGNVDKLQLAWSMSTGVLRGHEGSPLVIGDTLYMHSPF